MKTDHYDQRNVKTRINRVAVAGAGSGDIRVSESDKRFQIG